MAKKKFSKQLNKNISDGGHKTHTTALVLMVLFTGLVLTIALGDTDSLSSVANTDSSTTSTEEVDKPTETTTNTSNGQVAAAADPLANIPVDSGVEVKNEMITRDGEPVEQVITYETTRSNGDLTQTYRDWLVTHNYTIEKEKLGNYAASLAATNGDSALIVLISYLTAEDMSRVEIINYRR